MAVADLGVLCLRYIVGSWKATVVACAFVPVLTELAWATSPCSSAAVLLFALRDRRGAYLLPWVAALKFGPVLLVPYLWFRMPESRRPLVIGTAVFAGRLPGLVRAVAGDSGRTTSPCSAGRTARTESAPGSSPSSRRGAGSTSSCASPSPASWRSTRRYTRKAWLAYAAAVITCPILAFSRFAPLVALWRFRRRGRR